jgi:peptidoglycan/LPS O-acetylase OafA/YrhL
MSDPRGYREDLDTLRALAVGLVLIFHFDLIKGVSGGFLGVDVFFVISGYIITRKNLPGALDGSFSISQFWIARIRRLAPALIVTLAITLLAGAFYYLPSQLEALARQSLATQAYVANIYYWQTVNYFGLQAKQVPLLHTWSLAVEEQFYIVYPLLFLAARRLGTSRFFVTVLLLTLASFALCLAMLESRPEATFYLAPTRMWELGVGCLLAVGEWSRRQAAAPGAPGSPWPFLACLIVVVGSAAFYSKGIRTPGNYTLIPVLGTAGLIWFGGGLSGWLRSCWLDSRLRYLGHISYPLYLTHWPIHVFAKDMLRESYTWELRAGCALLSVLAAIAIHEWAEKPIAAVRGLSLSRVLKPYLAITALLSAACVAIIFSDGFPQRFSGQVLNVLQGEQDRPARLDHCIPEHQARQSAYQDERCLLGDRSRAPATALLGDSHAWALSPSIAAALQQQKQSGRLVFFHACPPLLGVHLQDGGRDDCFRHNSATFDWVIQQAPLKQVVLASTWIQGRSSLTDNPLIEPTPPRSQALFVAQFTETAKALKQAGKQVIVIGPVPAGKYHVPATLARNLLGRRPATTGLSFTLAEHRERFAYFYEAVRQAAPYIDGFFDPASVLCDSVECRVHDDAGAYYFDDDHLTSLGRARLDAGIRQVLALPQQPN